MKLIDKKMSPYSKANQLTKKIKFTALSACMTTLICASVSGYASDSEIYVVPATTPGKTTIMFMLDISDSMKGYGTCDYPDGTNRVSWEKNNAVYQHNGETTTYERNYCKVSSPRYFFKRIGNGTIANPYRYYKCNSDIGSYDVKDCNQAAALSKAPSGYYEAGLDPRYYYKNSDRINSIAYERIARLKDGMIALLNGDSNTEKMGDNIVVGLSTIGTVTNRNAQNQATAWKQVGSIVVPARPLGETVSGSRTQRDILINEVAKLEAKTLTPTAITYAEVAAYLMGRDALWHPYIYPNDSAYRNGVELDKAMANSPQSGFRYSSPDSKVATQNDCHYIMPESIKRQLGNSLESQHAKECSGQGIYVLTDGAPNEDWPSRWMMQKVLNDKNFWAAGDNWPAIKEFSQYLLDPAKNPLGIEIKTAVVGFAKSFDSSTTVTEAKQWGIMGKGGWYSGTDTQDVVDSVKLFLKEITKDVPSASTGASTIPFDTLNPEVIQPYSYFPQFEPKVDPSNPQQVWLGNIKKYYVVNNSVYASQVANSSTLVIRNSVLQDIADIWAKSNIVYPEQTPIYEKGGSLSQLVLGGDDGRKILTEYDYDVTDTDNPVSRNFSLKQIKKTYTTDATTKNDPNARALMALLGYRIDEDTSTDGLDLANITPELRQMGSSQHSLPILLTQQGRLYAQKQSGDDVFINSENRQDYILFGTSQGLLQVVDAKTGKEKFSFVPKEIIENQSETFKEKGGALTGGRYALYSGLDGEWTAHTVYVAKSDGTLTVNGAVRNVIGSTSEEKENLKGKQWVYGGMRMGGRSYYALDLTDIDNPHLKFHIDPASGMVYSKENPKGKSFPEIKNMGQSWSKPKLDYVNWKGKRKLVMLVSGGYDAGGENGDGLWTHGKRTGFAGYEYFNYRQGQAESDCKPEGESEDITCSTKNIGSGVYMFDADNGDLLWFADSRPSTGITQDVIHLQSKDLSYSTVTDIKTVDRNNDGIIDHLYLGDLAGQAFRIDLKNNGLKSTYDTQITKILDLHKSNGTSPRFYMSPVFTAHRSGGKAEGGDIVTVTFISGNKSSPLLATSDSLESTGQENSNNLEYDAVYAIYDYDIYPNGYYYPDHTKSLGARTLSSQASDTMSITKLKLIENTAKSNATITGAQVGKFTQEKGTDNKLITSVDKKTGWGGWYYPFKKTYLKASANPAVIKGLTPLIAMQNSLYVTMYDAALAGTTSGCGAGVKGQSFTKRLCLPTGVCPEDADYTYNLGSGIVSVTVGPDGKGGRVIIVPEPNPDSNMTKPCEGAGCKEGEDLVPAGGAIRFIPNRWYERYAKTS